MLHSASLWPSAILQKEAESMEQNTRKGKQHNSFEQHKQKHSGIHEIKQETEHETGSHFEMSGLWACCHPVAAGVCSHELGIWVEFMEKLDSPGLGQRVPRFEGLVELYYQLRHTQVKKWPTEKGCKRWGERACFKSADRLPLLYLSLRNMTATALKNLNSNAAQTQMPGELC